MRLSTKSEYACLAMIDLAERYAGGVLSSAADIAERKSIPRKYLEQLLSILKQAGYIRSQKGSAGGYRLAREPHLISVAEIVRLMDGALAPVESVSVYFYEPTPIEQSPKLIEVFREIRDFASRTLEATSFADLIDVD